MGDATPGDTNEPSQERFVSYTPVNTSPPRHGDRRRQRNMRIISCAVDDTASSPEIGELERLFIKLSEVVAKYPPERWSAPFLRLLILVFTVWLEYVVDVRAGGGGSIPIKRRR